MTPKKLADLGFLSERSWGWGEGDVVKSLLLFFDGIALLAPEYIEDRVFEVDPVLAEPLADKGLLHILSPETMVSESIANDLAELLDGLLSSDALDLSRGEPFGEISRSQLGLEVSPDLMSPLVASLEKRGLIKQSEHESMRWINRSLRAIVLGTLGQLLRGPGEQLGYALQPITTDGYESTVYGLLRLLDREPLPTAGHVVVSDLQQVSFDLSAIPLDEVLDFRAQHGDAYRAYARDLRGFVRSVSTVDPADRESAFADRREALGDAAADLNRHMRTAWRRPMASLAWGLAAQRLHLPPEIRFRLASGSPAHFWVSSIKRTRRLYTPISLEQRTLGRLRSAEGLPGRGATILKS